MAENRIKKVKLSNGSIYSIFDEGALRLNANKVLLTGNTVVDEVILQGQFSTERLSITEIDDIPIAQLTEDVLVTDANGNVYKENIRDLFKEVTVALPSFVEDEILKMNSTTALQFNLER